MSIAALGYVFLLSLPANEKWLLVCLADYADEWGESVFPTLDTLEEKSGMSRKTLKRTFGKLIERGVLERAAEATPVSPSFYRIVGVPEPTHFTKEPNCPAPLRRAVIHAFAARCEYCGQVGSKDLGPDGKSWTIDRITPGRRGGIYAPENVTLACRFCNGKKRTHPAPPTTRSLSQLQREGRGQIDPSLGGQNDPSGGVKLSRGRGQADPRSVIDPLTDPSEEKAGAAPRDTPRTDNNPDRNLGVITTIAHEVLDAVLAADVDELDVREGIKALCATRHIPYNSSVVVSAYRAAVWQREHRHRDEEEETPA